MKNSLSLLFLMALTSCNQQNPIQNTFIAKSDEYWRCYSSYSSSNSCYRFNDNNLYYAYSKNQEGLLSKMPDAPYMKESDQKWSVSQDSIMYWNNFFYDVVSYNDKAIVLTYQSKEKPYVYYIFLIKENERDLKKFPNDFEEKRIYNPEKYRLRK